MDASSSLFLSEFKKGAVKIFFLLTQPRAYFLTFYLSLLVYNLFLPKIHFYFFNKCFCMLELNSRILSRSCKEIGII